MWKKKILVAGLQKCSLVKSGTKGGVSIVFGGRGIKSHRNKKTQTKQTASLVAGLP